MIYGIKKPDPVPMIECPSFNRCNANLCPLDPDIDDRPYVGGDDRCKGEKPTRHKIALKYPQLLPLQGYTKSEWGGIQAWVNMSVAKKKKITRAGVNNLKTLKKSK